MTCLNAAIKFVFYHSSNSTLISNSFWSTYVSLDHLTPSRMVWLDSLTCTCVYMQSNGNGNTIKDSTISKEGSCSLCHHNLTQSVPPEYSFSYIWDHSTQVHTMIVRTQFIPNMVITKDWPTLHKNRFPPQQDYCPTRSRFCPEHRHYPQKTAVQRDTTLKELLPPQR